MIAKNILSTFILTLISFACFAQVNLSKGLIAYYPFDGNAGDSSGNQLDGTVHGAILTTDRFGRDDHAYAFNGTSSYIQVDHDSLLNLKDSFSISLWYIKDSPQNSTFIVNGILYKGRDVENCYAISLANNKEEMFYVRPSTDIPPFANPDEPASFGVWHNLIGIYTGDSVKLYIDGDLEDAEAISGFRTDNTYPLIFGRHFRYADGSGSYEFPFKGKMDDIRIYNRILNAHEIGSINSNESSGVHSLTKVNESIDVYPNPLTGGTKTLHISGIPVGSTIILYDLNGRSVLVKQASANGDKLSLAVGNLKSGVYFLRVIGEHQSLTQKVVINQ